MVILYIVTSIYISWTTMSDEEPKVPEELFKDVKFYVVGDIDQKVKLARSTAVAC